MGWDFRSQNGKSNTEEIKKEILFYFNKGTIKDISVKSTEAYILHNDNRITVALIANNEKEIGFKFMSETSHPFYYNAPKKWIEDGSNEWRKKCLENIEKDKILKNLKVLTKIEFTENKFKYNSSQGIKEFNTIIKTQNGWSTFENGEITTNINIPKRMLKNNKWKIIQ